MANIYDMSDTWNDGATTFTSIKMNVTDTASAAGSLLMDLQVGGASKFKVRKDGFTRIDGPSNAISVAVGSDAVGIGNFFAGLGFYRNSTLTALVASDTLRMQGSGFFSWGSSQDLELHRDAAETMAQRRGTNAQTFNLYNTYTDASNYERGFMKWNSNVLEIGAEAAGTGTARLSHFLTQNAASANAPQFKLADYSTGITLRGNDDVFIVCNGIVNASFQNSGSARIISWNGAADVGFSSGEALSTVDTSFSRVGAGVMGVRGGNATTGGAINLLEQTAPAAPAANQVVIYAEDDGAGKTRLMALFPTGAAQQIAIEP